MKDFDVRTIAMPVPLWSISFLILFGSETLASSSRYSHQKCGVYGLPPCNFVPATSGITPLCASMGKTYCEYVPNYPYQAVRLQLERWGIDNVNDLIVDETVDEFDPPKPSTTPIPEQPNNDPNMNQDPNMNEDPRNQKNPPGARKPPNEPNNPLPEPLNPPQDPRGFEKPKKPAQPSPPSHDGGQPQDPRGQPNGPAVPPEQKPPHSDPNDPRTHQQPPNINSHPPFIPDVPNTVFDGGYDYPNPNDKPIKTPPPPLPPVPPPPPLPTHLPPTPPPPPQPIGGYIPTFIHFNDIDGFWRSTVMQQQPPVAVSTISFLIHNQRYVRDLSSHSHARNFSEKFPPQVKSHRILPPTKTAVEPRETLSSYHDLFPNYRSKRQAFGKEQLCKSTYQYITPQAALNSQGNWMYIVNQVDTTRQLVRTETCASTVCSNVCQLPNGYTSECEQKYVQKRLIALNADGTNLYTDTFWFPSCCACTISGPT